ncbi:MAG: 3',5'-cyclic-AMP phosphodiesterase [Pseudomonas aeruginosa]|nr:3',5'-cyclic-AMP phosphodiesterase [Pseudomonas aeruginosa]
MSRHSNTPATDASVLLVQLSDSHLFAEDGARLLGMDTAHSLEKVVERVAREQPRIDLILATGDVSQDGSLDSYTRFRRLSAPLDAPLRWFAGNHDEREPMQRATEGSDLLEQVVDVGNWRVVLLDSSIPGAVPGYLEEDQLELLRRAIDSAGERFLLVSFHHHPVPIGSDWMDPIGLRNPQALFDLLAPYPQVRCLLWGHIHQEFDRQRGPLRLLASPSTCVQFAPGSSDFTLDRLAPGYRWLRRHDDGRLETGISRVDDVVFEVDYDTAGY